MAAPPSPRDHSPCFGGGGSSSGASSGAFPARRGTRSSVVFSGPKDVERLSNHPAVVAFTAWIGSRFNGWDAVHEFFIGENAVPGGGGSFADRSIKGARGITKSRWVQLLNRQGFSHAKYAEEIYNEVSTEPGAPLAQPGDEGSISASQFQRFQVRIMSVSSMVPTADEHSPAARFVKLIKQRRGSVLRAWIADIDLRRSGKVACQDFIIACRKFGIGHQAKLVWDNLRPEGVAPLEVHELDVAEANNLEDFAEALWNTVGLDLNKAWEYLDPNHQQHLCYEDFKHGAQALGFKGDTRLLFKGLDVNGFGRVGQQEFAYIAKVSRIVQRRLGGQTQGNSAVADLIKWVQRELGGAQELLLRLGLGNPGGPREISVGELAARLTALGFEGDAVGAASRAARSEGGTHISAENLFLLMSGMRNTTAAAVASNANDGRPTTPRGGNTTPRRVVNQDWNNRVHNISTHNEIKCKHTKQYFNPDAIGASPHRPRSATPRGGGRVGGGGGGGAAPGGSQGRPLSPQQVRRRAASARRIDRPAWNSNYDAVCQTANEGVSSHSRRYFSDPAQKPVRDRQRAMVEARMLAKVQPAWEMPLSQDDLDTF